MRTIAYQNSWCLHHGTSKIESGSSGDHYSHLQSLVNNCFSIHNITRESNVPAGEESHTLMHIFIWVTWSPPYEQFSANTAT